MATIKKGLLFLLLNVIVLVPGAPVVEASGLAARQDPDFQCEFRTLETVMLQSFNIHRANHSVGPLEWNETLATAALNTVQFGPDLVHDNSGKDWGQTLYAWYWSDPNNPGLEPQAAVSSWYNDEFQRYQAYGEASKLDLEHNPSVNSPPATPPGSVYGHFTQVIWKDTKTVGCAAWPKKSSDEKYYGIYVACNYYPGGNYVTNDNTWVDNVLPPRGDDVLKILCGGVPILPPNVDDPPA